MTNKALVFFFFVAVFPTLFFVSLGNGVLHPIFVWTDATTIFIYAILTCWIGKRLADLVLDRTGTFNILRIPFNIFYYVFFLLIPANFYFNSIEYTHVTVNFSDESYRNGFILILVSFSSFTIGDICFKNIQGSLKVFRERLDLSQMARLPVVIVALCAMSVMVFIATLGDIDFLFMDRSQLEEYVAATDSQSASLLLDALVRVPAFCALYFAIYLWLNKFWVRTGPWAVMMFCLVIPAFFIFNFPASVPRLWLGGTAIAIVILFCKHKYRQANMSLVFFLMFSLMLIFPLIHLLRFVFSIGIESDLTSAILGAFSDAQFDAFPMAMIIQTYVDDAGHGYGWQTLSALLFFVPRSFFPSKGKSTGTVVGEALGFSFVNISSPFVVEMYYDFGYWGVILVFFLMGYIAHRIDDKWSKGEYGFGGTLLVPYLSGWSFILLRGSLFTALTYLAPMALLVLFSNVFIRRKITQNTLLPSRRPR